MGYSPLLTDANNLNDVYFPRNLRSSSHSGRRLPYAGRLKYAGLSDHRRNQSHVSGPKAIIIIQLLNDTQFYGPVAIL